MKRFKKITSAIVSVMTAFSIVTSSLPTMIVNAANTGNSARPYYMDRTTYNIDSLFGEMYDGRTWLQSDLYTTLGAKGDEYKYKYANDVANGYNFAMSKFNEKQTLYRKSVSSDTTVTAYNPGNTALGVNTVDSTKPTHNFINLKYDNDDKATAKIDGYIPTTDANDNTTTDKKNHLWHFSTGLGKSTYKDGTLKYGGYAVILQDYDKGSLAYQYPSVGTYTDETGKKTKVDLKVTVLDYDYADEVTSSSRSVYFTKEEYDYLKSKLGETTVSGIFNQLLENVTVTHSSGKSFTYQYVIPNMNYTKATEAKVFTTINGYENRTVNNRNNLYSCSELPLIRFKTNQVGVDVYGISWVELKYDFTDHSTGKSIKVKGYTAWKDIDYSQGVSFSRELIDGSSSNKVVKYGTWTNNITPTNKFHMFKIGFDKKNANGTNTRYTGYFEQNRVETTLTDEYAWLYAAFDTTYLKVIYSFCGPSKYTTKGFVEDANITTSSDSSATRFTMVNPTGTITNDLPSINLKRSMVITKNIKSATGEYTSASNYPDVISDLRFYLVDGAGRYVTVSGSAGSYTYIGTSTAEAIPSNALMSLGAYTGKVTINNLPIDAYTICESEATGSGLSKLYDLSARKTVDLSDGVTDWNTTPNALSTTITNNEYATSVVIQKTVTQTDGTKSNATSENVKSLIEGVRFALKDSNGYYANFDGGKITGFGDEKSYIYLDNNGQFSIDNLPFGIYTIEESAKNNDVKSIWQVEKEVTLDFTPDNCSFANGVYSYSMEFDNPELYGGLTIKKITATGEDISGIKFYLSGVSDSGRKISMSVTTDSNGNGIYDKVPVGTYTLSEDPDTVPDGWTVAPNRIVSIVSGQTAEASITEVENTPIQPKTGEIRITKVDSETSALLAGAEFSIYSDVNQNKSYDSSDTFVDKITITGSGVGSNSNLPIGDYFVKETKAPDGYIIDDNYYFVTVSEGMTTTVKTNNNGFANTQIKGSIKVNKVDSEDTTIKLSGAIFTVFNDVDGNGQYQSAVDTLVDTLIDNGDGTYVIDNLPYGKYVVRESKAPAGYKLDVNNYPVNITENGMTYIVNNIHETELFGNTPIKGNIKLTKVDSENTSAKLSGAVFTVYNESGKSVGTMTENNGVYTMSSVRYGKYTVKETKAPTGYAIDTKAYSVNITENGMTYVISNITGTELFGNEPIKGNIKLTKVDSENTSAKLSGAIFTVFNDVDGNGQYQSAVDTLVDTLIDNGDGTYVIDNLPYGKYVVRESKAPKGYLLDVKNYAVNITENGMTYVISNIAGTELFGNTPIKGNIELTKVDSENTSVKLSGAVFTVYDESGKSVGTMTDTNGVYTMSNIRYGKYTVKETKAPTGYAGDTNIYTVNITENGKTYVVSNIDGTELFANTPIKGNIKVIKVDSENTSIKLTGAKFHVYNDVDGNGQYQSAVDALVGTMTENNGVYTMPNLKYGKYVVRESKAPTGYKLDVKNYPVNITEDGKNYVISNIAGTELFGNEPQPCKIVLTKRIPLDEVNGKIWFEHGNPTFILKLVNTTPGDEYNRTYYQAVEFTKEYVDNNTITVDGKKYVDMSVTFDELSAGTYTASEAIVGQRYKFNRLLNIKNGVANGKQCDFTLSSGQVGQATFYNVKRSFDTNTHNSLCVNVIKK